jgi:tRNA(Ile)-lysidine synthase
VSGGSDSVALALLAAHAGLATTLHHVDHQLRSTGSREAALVAALADRLSARFEPHVVVIAPGPNLEARARAARKDVLPTGTLTAHTMDDQAETVLLNFLRGSGIDGLAGMAPATKPLLELRRAELRSFVADAGEPFVVDPSNFDLSLRRNLLRARILPELCQAAGRDLVPVLARQARVLREDAAYLDDVAAFAVEDPFDVASLRGAPVAVRRRRLRDVVRATGDGHPPSSDEIDRMESVVLHDAVATELTGGRRVVRHDGRLRIELE